jgi:8-oxo-dGTP diphosphatase
MIHVTCAVIRECERYLICQRSEQMKMPLKWEFPGGKVEEGESLEDCLIREIQEELAVIISVDEALEQVLHHYDSLSITLYPFLCTIKEGAINLKEHAQYKWVLKNEISQYDLAAADVLIIKFI